jgi:raffinose/stachyose/melibiose transport system permease protein
MWFGSTRAALPSIIFVVSWRHVGFHMVILLAGLVSIPEELYEAARVDGAGAWGCFRHVTLPMMSRPLKVSAMLAVVGSVRYFDLVYIMTNGGPAGSTELVATYMFKSGLGEAGEYSYGAALAVLLVAASMIVLGAARLCLSRESAVEVVR